MSNYVRDTGEIIRRPTPGAPAWVRAQQQVYGPSLPGGMGLDLPFVGELDLTTVLFGVAAVGGLLWFLKKRK